MQVSLWIKDSRDSRTSRDNKGELTSALLTILGAKRYAASSHRFQWSATLSVKRVNEGWGLRPAVNSITILFPASYSACVQHNTMRVLYSLLGMEVDAAEEGAGVACSVNLRWPVKCLRCKSWTVISGTIVIILYFTNKQPLGFAGQEHISGGFMMLISII